MPLLLVHGLPDKLWRDLLQECLLEASTFRLHLPDGEGPLSAGRHDAQRLPGAVTEHWAGMQDALEIYGPLSPQARAFFVAHETSLILFDPERKLWDYQLLRDGKTLLAVSDFTVLIIDTEAIDLVTPRVPAHLISPA